MRFMYECTKLAAGLPPSPRDQEVLPQATVDAVVALVVLGVDRAVPGGGDAHVETGDA